MTSLVDEEIETAQTILSKEIENEFRLVLRAPSAPHEICLT